MIYRKSRSERYMLIGGIGLLIIAVFISLARVNDFNKSWQSLSWVKTEAKVTKNENTSSKYNFRYHYIFKGNNYTNTKISYFHNYKKFSGRWDKVQRQLKESYQSNSPITVFVNPEQPSESVVDNYFSYPQALGLILFLLGLFFLSILMILHWLSHYLESRQRAILQVKFPHEPWLWRKEWMKGYITPRNSSDLRHLLAGSILIMTLFSGLMAFLGKRFYVYPEVLFCILIGLILLPIIVLLLLRKRKYGYSELHLKPLPYFTGQKNHGQLLVKSTTIESQQLMIKLTCRHYQLEHSIGNATVKIRSLWSKEAKVSVSRQNSLSLLDFCFDIPAALPDSGNNLSDDCIQWILEVHADVPSVDLKHRYEIPVFNFSHKQELIKYQIPNNFT